MILEGSTTLFSELRGKSYIMAVSLALLREDTGMGRAWLGDLVFNMEEQVSEPENLFGGRHDTPSSTTLTSNRYGFSGKERQNIFSSTDPYLDFGARFYDPLTTRWLSPDPMADKYTSLTQYNYCGGDPVNFVDEDGKKIVFAENASPEFKRAFAQTVKYMNSRGTAGNLAILESSPFVYTISEASNGNNHFTRSTKTIYWDYQHLFETSSSIWISPATALDHETEHAKRYDSAIRSTSQQEKKDYVNKNQPNSDTVFDTIEEKEIITGREQSTARKHKEIGKNQVTRNDHEITVLNGTTKGLSPQQIEKKVKEHNEIL